MTPQQPLRDLVVKLEAATKGSRELDAQIHREAFNEHAALIDGKPNFGHYTTSIDAALMLAQDGDYDQHWTKSARGKETWEHWTLWQVRISRETAEEDPEETGPVALGCANTPALAVCIATLRTRLTDD